MKKKEKEWNVWKACSERKVGGRVRAQHLLLCSVSYYAKYRHLCMHVHRASIGAAARVEENMLCIHFLKLFAILAQKGIIVHTTRSALLQRTAGSVSMHEYNMSHVSYILIPTSCGPIPHVTSFVVTFEFANHNVPRMEARPVALG